MAFVADSVTLADLGDALQQAGISTLASQMTNVNTRCHAKAYSYIVERLLRRGYTAAQVAAWDSAHAGPVERDMTIFFALSLAFVNTQVSPEMLKAYDRREDLETLAITTSGDFVYPLGSAGLCGSGTLSTGGDLFVWPDPDDPMLGEVTQW